MNPFNFLASMYQYLMGSPIPVSMLGGGFGLLWDLAYLIWVNSGSYRTSRRRRRTRSRSYMYNRDSFSDFEQRTSSIENMDTISESSSRQLSVQENLSKSVASNSGRDDLDPFELVSFVNKKKKIQSRNLSDDSYQPTPSRRRNKVALKRLQKKPRRQLKKREDTEELKGRRNKKCKHDTKTSSNRSMNDHSCCFPQNM